MRNTNLKYIINFSSMEVVYIIENGPQASLKVELTISISSDESVVLHLKRSGSRFYLSSDLQYKMDNLYSSYLTDKLLLS